ncbi:unnamed protein product [Porites lobata]|uniref:DDE Tnp4 domain-containing protein n=1 Tax=Porites lobata TaxID=104759 RepID=A0ABN8N528_9CNID|nr:unnamed protein product [Porites lobata]
MSLKEVRNQVFISHDDGVINDEELLLMYDLNRSDNLDLPYNSYPDFDFDDLEDDECISEFRFYKNDLPFLAEVLGIPDVVECYQRSVCSGLEALCIFLKRHSYPCRYSDMIALSGKPVPVLCMINNSMIEYIYQAHSHRILQWNDSILNPYSLEIYSNAITAKGSPLDNCFGFIDGTVRPISKPCQNQRVVGNGHKRVHDVKFQSVALPNGIIGNIYRPIEGRRHDAAMLADSNLLQDMQRYAFSPGLAGHPLCVYGDPDYPLRVHLQMPFRNMILTPQMVNFNKAVSSVRVSVEWLFGGIVEYFKFVDFKKNLKIGLSSIGKMYIVCALLRNPLTCLSGNTTSEFFELDPPTLEV